MILWIRCISVEKKTTHVFSGGFDKQSVKGFKKKYIEIYIYIYYQSTNERMSGAKECCSCMLTCTQPHWGGFLNVRPQGLISVMVSMSIMSVMFGQVVELILAFSFKERLVQEVCVHTNIIYQLFWLFDQTSMTSLLKQKPFFHGGPWGPVLGDPDFNDTCWGAYSSALNNLVPYRLRMLIHWLELWI